MNASGQIGAGNNGDPRLNQLQYSTLVGLNNRFLSPNQQNSPNSTNVNMQAQTQNLIATSNSNTANLNGLISLSSNANTNQNTNPPNTISSPNGSQNSNQNSAQNLTATNQANTQNLYISNSPNSVPSAVQQLQQLYATESYLAAAGQPLTQVLGYQVNFTKHTEFKLDLIFFFLRLRLEVHHQVFATLRTKQNLNKKNYKFWWIRKQ